MKKVFEKLSQCVGDLSPRCREAARLQSLALDSQVSWRKRIGLRIHLLLCKWCRRYGNQIRFLRETAHEHPAELTEAGRQKLSDEARDRIRNSLRSKRD